jgi:hypothetical protein
MRRTPILVQLPVLLLLLTTDGVSETLAAVVPGTSDLWLAGMPPGSRASGTDVAPNQSPVEVTDFSLQVGAILAFRAVGLVSNGVCGPPFCPTFGPDGGIKPDQVPFFHDNGAENGISNLGAPINSLIGLFLGSSAPILAPAAASLDFNSLAAQDYLILSPLLQQAFFIGDGLTIDGIQQHIIIPVGASRLYLGTMDGCCWIDNSGSFIVQVSELPGLPEPMTVLLLASGLVLLVTIRGAEQLIAAAHAPCRTVLRSLLQRCQHHLHDRRRLFVRREHHLALEPVRAGDDDATRCGPARSC